MMRLRCVQALLLIVRITVMINVHFAVLHTTVSTIRAPLTLLECVVGRLLGMRQQPRC